MYDGLASSPSGLFVDFAPTMFVDLVRVLGAWVIWYSDN